MNTLRVLKQKLRYFFLEEALASVASLVINANEIVLSVTACSFMITSLVRVKRIRTRVMRIVEFC